QLRVAASAPPRRQVARRIAHALVVARAAPPVSRSATASRSTRARVVCSRRPSIPTWAAFACTQAPLQARPRVTQTPTHSPSVRTSCLDARCTRRIRESVSSALRTKSRMRCNSATVAAQPANVSMQTPGMMQRQEAGQTGLGGRPFRPFTSQPEFQLHLDPEIEAMMLQNYVRGLVSSSITEGEPSGGPQPTTGGDTGETTGQTVPVPHELPSSFFQRYDPETIGVEPDVGAILAPYHARNVPLGARDVDAATTIFRQNYAFVNTLPDLRDAAPSFLRPLIPSHWLRSMAEAFTAATLNAQLKSDFPTPIEADDLSFYRMTRVSTTYIPIQGFSF